MGFISDIWSGIKELGSRVRDIITRAPIPPSEIELADMKERTDKFGKARYDLMDKYGMRKDEASKTAKEISFMDEADVPPEYIDSWRLMYPE